MIVRAPRNFVLVPKHALKHDLSRWELHILATIYHLGENAGKPCNLIELKDLSKEVGCSEENCLLAIHSLEQKKLLTMAIEVGVIESEVAK